MRAKFVFEKFTKESDPIQDMNIGMREQIENAIINLFENKKFYDSIMHAVEKIYINKQGKYLKMELIRGEIMYSYTKTHIDELLQNTILNTCLIYPKEIKAITPIFGRYWNVKNYYIAKVKPEYWDLFKTLKQEYSE